MLIKFCQSLLILLLPLTLLRGRKSSLILGFIKYLYSCILGANEQVSVVSIPSWQRKKTGDHLKISLWWCVSTSEILLSSLILINNGSRIILKYCRRNAYLNNRHEFLSFERTRAVLPTSYERQWLSWNLS